MSLLSPIKDHHSERRLFIGRAVLASVISVILLGVVIARLVQLQVFDHELFAEKSQGNRVRIEAVPPIRGLILDRKGRVIAENLPAYQLELIPEQVDDIDDTLSRLAAINLIEQDDIPRFTALTQSGQQFKPVTLKFRLSDEEIANFAIQSVITRTTNCLPTRWVTSARLIPMTCRDSTLPDMRARRTPARLASKAASKAGCTVMPVFDTSSQTHAGDRYPLIPVNFSTRCQWTRHQALVPTST